MESRNKRKANRTQSTCLPHIKAVLRPTILVYSFSHVYGFLWSECLSVDGKVVVGWYQIIIVKQRKMTVSRQYNTEVTAMKKSHIIQSEIYEQFSLSNLRLSLWIIADRLPTQQPNSCIFEPCDLLPTFPPLHIPALHFWPYRIFHSRIFSRPICSRLQKVVDMSSFPKRAALLSPGRNLASTDRPQPFPTNKVCLGLPVLRRQSLGWPRIQVWRAREWYWCRYDNE